MIYLWSHSKCIMEPRTRPRSLLSVKRLFQYTFQCTGKAYSGVNIVILIKFKFTVFGFSSGGSHSDRSAVLSQLYAGSGRRKVCLSAPALSPGRGIS